VRGVERERSVVILPLLLALTLRLHRFWSGLVEWTMHQTAVKRPAQ